MKRRRFIALAGAALTSGCGALNDRSAITESGRFERGTTVPPAERGTRTPTRTATGTPTGTEPPADEPPTATRTETDTPAEIETPTETETATPTVEPDPDAAEAIQEAQTLLGEAATAYADQGDGNDLRGVDPTLESFDPNPVTRKTTQATEALDRAEETAVDWQQDLVESLRDGVLLVENGARAEPLFIEMFDKFLEARDRLYNESLSQAMVQKNEMVDILADARDLVGPVQRETTLDSAWDFEHLEYGTFFSKRLYLRYAVSTFRNMAAGLEKFKRGLEWLKRGIEQYVGRERENRERADDAASKFFNARLKFLTAKSDLSIVFVEPLQPETDELSGVADVLDKASQDMKTAAEATAEHEDGLAEDHHEMAEEHIRSSEIAMRMRTPSRIVESY